MSTRRGSATAKAKEDSCPQCKNAVSEKDMGIQCEICEDWFHAKCQGMDEAEYKFVNEHKVFHWYCRSCDKNAASMIQLMSKMRQRQDKLEEEVEKVKANVSKLTADSMEANAKNGKRVENIEKGIFTEDMVKRVEREVERVAAKIKAEIGTLSQEVRKIKDSSLAIETKLETAIEAKLVEEFSKPVEQRSGDTRPSFASVVAKQIDNKLDKVSGDLTKVQQVIVDTKKIAEEEKDRESRGNNIVIYRVEECDTNENRVKHDKAFCLELLKGTLDADVQEEDLKSVFRIGKKDSNSSCRPLLVQLRERSVKNKIMESLFKLKNADDKFKRVSITHDLTKTERAECKTLIEEAKKKQSEETGEFLWRVRGLPGHLKVIRIRKQ